MRRLSIVMAAVLAAVGLGSLVAANPAGAAVNGVACQHVAGTLSGNVTLASCHPAASFPFPPQPGKGSMPGSVLVGTSSGTINWTQGKHSYATAITITTALAPNPGRGWCARKGSIPYYVTGTVTGSTHPDIAVGSSVSGRLCISAASAVMQSHYGGISL